jgi:hypothetical protein
MSLKVTRETSIIFIFENIGCLKKCIHTLSLSNYHVY